MDKKSKILIVVVFILIGVSAIFTFYRTMVAKDYPIVQTEQ